MATGIRSIIFGVRLPADRRKRSYRKLLPLSLGLSLTLGGYPVVADEVTEATEQQPQQRRGLIEEVVVTAQRRESTLQDAAMSISVIGGNEMRYRRVNNITDMQTQVPGLSVSESGGAVLVSIRGVGMNVDSGAVEPGVAVHIDGVYQPRPSIGPLGLNDLQRVEVLRGPQGTLYGRNSTGGVINFLLNKPTETPELELRLGRGSFDRRSAVAIVSGPIVEGQLLGRLVAEWDDEGGYVKDMLSGRMSDDRRGKGGRLALSWLPSESLSLDLAVLYRDDEGAGLAPRDVIRIAPDPDMEFDSLLFAPADRSTPDQSAEGEHWKRKLNFLPRGERDTTNLNLTATWAGDAVTVRSQTGYQDHGFIYRYDSDFTANDIFVFRPDGFQGTSESWSQEVTASGSFRRLDWLVGGYYFEEDYSPLLQMNVPKALFGAGLNLLLTSEEETKSEAFFTDITYALTDALRLNLGLRSLKDTKSARQTNRFVAGGTVISDVTDLLPILDGVVPPNIEIPEIPDTIATCEREPVAVKSKRELTPKYALQWDISDTVTSYVQYTEGFKSGGTNFSACGDTYEPEEVKSYEVGLKSTWFDRRLMANLSVFDASYTNFQVLKIDDFSARIINAPKARIRGADLELMAMVAEPVTLTAAVSLLDAYYQEFFDSDNTNPEAGEQNLKGVQLSRAPDYTVNLGVEYSWDMSISDLFRHWRLRAEWFRSDDVVYRPFGGAEDGQSAYTLVNTYLSVMDSDERFALRLFGKNLQNTGYYLYAAGDSIGRIYGPSGEPRSFGIEMSFHFR